MDGMKDSLARQDLTERAFDARSSASRTMPFNITMDTIDPRSMDAIGPVSLGLLGLALAWSMSKMGGDDSDHIILEGDGGEMQEMVRQHCRKTNVKCN